MAINEIKIGSNRQSSLKAGVAENNFVRVQDVNTIVDEANTDIAANTAATTALSATVDSRIQVVEYNITEANIVGMNGTPVTVLAAQGAGTAIEFISAVLIYDYDTAAYTGGGDVTLEYTGGATLSTTVAAANSFAAAGDKVFSMAALDAAGGYTMPVNTGIDITNATGAFVDPGTAAGVGRIRIAYRVHTTGL
jgi:hypothetical protein